jgi:hypothetical protein
MTEEKVYGISFGKFTYDIEETKGEIEETKGEIEETKGEIEETEGETEGEIKIKNYILKSNLIFNGIELISFKINDEPNTQTVYFYTTTTDTNHTNIINAVIPTVTINVNYDCIFIKDLNTKQLYLFNNKNKNNNYTIIDTNNKIPPPTIQKKIEDFENDIDNSYETNKIISIVNKIFNLNDEKNQITKEILNNSIKLYTFCENLYIKNLEKTYNDLPIIKKVHAINENLGTRYTDINKICNDLNKDKLSDFIQKLNEKYKPKNNKISIDKFQYLIYIEKLKSYTDDLSRNMHKFIELKVKPDIINTINEKLETKVNNAIITYVKINSTNPQGITRPHRFRFYLNKNKKNMIVQYNDLHEPYNEKQIPVTDEAQTNEAQTDEDTSDEAQTDEAQTDEAQTDAQTDEAQTDEAQTDAQTDEIFNNKPKYLFGNFTKIFTLEDKNEDVVNEMTNIVNQTLISDPPPIFIVGYGASGAGKTSNLIYLRRGAQSQDGILPELCKKIIKEHKDKQDINFTKIILNVKEYSVYDVVNDVNVSNSFDSNQYEFTLNDKKKIVLNGNRDVKINHAYNFDFKLDTDEKQQEIYSILKKNDSNEFEFIENTELGIVIVFLVDVDRIVKATTNNPQSSRSHVLVFVEIYFGEKIVKLIVGDFAGIENRFLCDNKTTIEKMGTLENTKTNKPFYINQSFYKGKISNFDTIRGGGGVTRIKSKLLDESKQEDTDKDILDGSNMSLNKNVEEKINKYLKNPLLSAFFELYIKAYDIIDKTTNYTGFLDKNKNKFNTYIMNENEIIKKDMQNKIDIFKNENTGDVKQFDDSSFLTDINQKKAEIENINTTKQNDADLNDYNTKEKTFTEYKDKATINFNTAKTELTKTYNNIDNKLAELIDNTISTYYSDYTIHRMIQRQDFFYDKTKKFNLYDNTQITISLTDINGYGKNSPTIDTNYKFYNQKFDYKYDSLKIDNLPEDFSDVKYVYYINYIDTLKNLKLFMKNTITTPEITIPINIYFGGEKGIYDTMVIRIDTRRNIEIQKLDSTLINNLSTIINDYIIKKNMFETAKVHVSSLTQKYDNEIKTIEEEIQKIDLQKEAKKKIFDESQSSETQQFTNMNTDLISLIKDQKIGETIKNNYQYSLIIITKENKTIKFNYSMQKKEFVLYYLLVNKNNTEYLDLFIKYITKQYFLYTACNNRLAEGDWINHELKELRKAIEIVVKSKNFDVFYNYNDSCFTSNQDYKPENLSKSKNIEDAQNNTFIKSILEHYKKLDSNTTLQTILDKMVICIYCVFNYGYKDIDEPPNSPYLNIDNLNKIKQDDAITKIIEALNALNESLTNTKISPFINSSIIINDIISPLQVIGLNDQKDQIELGKFLIILLNQLNITKKIRQTTAIKQAIFSIIQCIRNHINILNATSAMGSLEFIDQVAKLNTVNYLCTTKNISDEYTPIND